MIDLTVTETDRENFEKVLTALKKLAEDEILIGITKETDVKKKGPKGERKGKINNAELAYIHTNGVRGRQMREETDAAVESGTPYPLALQAYIKEHGSPAYAVPPRPFLKPGIEKNLDLVEKGMKIALLDVLKGGDGMAQRKRLGGTMASKVRNYFQEDNGWPSNAPSTIERKGSDLPLVNTGALRQAITYIVRKKEG